MAEETVEIPKGIFGGIAGGIIAALYGIGPMIMVLLGADIAQATALVKYTPFYILGGLLVTFGYLLFITKGNFKRKKDIAAAVGSFVVTFAFLMFLVTPLASTAVYGVKETVSVAPSGNYRELTLSINGMACSGCAASIQGILQSLDGVVSSKTSLATKSAVVIYDPSKISKEAIVKNEIFYGSYSAEIVSDKPYEG